MHATLIRHAYVAPSQQSRGIGNRLLSLLISPGCRPFSGRPWAAIASAIRLYEPHGFRLVPTDEKERLLITYWDITSRQRKMSVFWIMPVRLPTVFNPLPICYAKN